MHALQLIALYDYVCRGYTTTLQWQVQRFSPNSNPDGISHEELITAPAARHLPLLYSLRGKN